MQRGVVLEPYNPAGTLEQAADVTEALSQRTGNGDATKVRAMTAAELDFWLAQINLATLRTDDDPYRLGLGALRNATEDYLTAVGSGQPSQGAAATYAAELHRVIALITLDPDYADYLSPANAAALVRASTQSIANPAWDATKRKQLTSSIRASNVPYRLEESLVLGEGPTAQNLIVELLKQPAASPADDAARRSVFLQAMLGLLETPEEIRRKLKLEGPLPLLRADPKLAAAITFLTIMFSCGAYEYYPPLDLNGLTAASLVGSANNFGALKMAHAFMNTAALGLGSSIDAWDAIVSDEEHPLFMRLAELAGTMLAGVHPYGPDSGQYQHGMLARRREAFMNLRQQRILAREAVRISIRGPRRRARAGLDGLVLG